MCRGYFAHHSDPHGSFLRSRRSGAARHQHVCDHQDLDLPAAILRAHSWRSDEGNDLIASGRQYGGRVVSCAFDSMYAGPG
jgi:hypothetical protein